jgi:hypothetical protein
MLRYYAHARATDGIGQGSGAAVALPPRIGACKQNEQNGSANGGSVAAQEAEAGQLRPVRRWFALPVSGRSRALALAVWPPRSFYWRHAIKLG